MANPATVNDVADRWRPLSADESVVALASLEDAWALATLEVPDLDARLTADPAEIDPSIVRMVICAAVLRVLRNPDGKRQETIEDYSYTLAVGEGEPGSVYFTEAELTRLRARPPVPTGAFTIRPYGAPDGTILEELGWS
ncbi:MAG: hypothetical protein KDB37_05505 [Ilumatobacter sp.]|nr:hypothetical protein [Ilumatobacter sp.]